MLKRTVTGLVIGAYVLLMVLLGRVALTINIVLLLLIGTFEVLDSLKKGGFKPNQWIPYLCVLVMLPALLWKGGTGLLFVVVLGVVGAMAFAALHSEPSEKAMTAALLPVLYPALPMMAMLILVLSPNALWRLYVWMLFAVAVGSDCCAFYFGKLFGKHKLIPSVSPNKTIEGAIGGFFGGVLVSFIVYLFSLYNNDGIAIGHFIAMGVIGSIFTQVGDLVASYIKRFCGVKDYGTLFPGHGGVLDRVDGIMFNAIAVCLYVVLFMGGIS